MKEQLKPTKRERKILASIAARAALEKAIKAGFRFWKPNTVLTVAGTTYLTTNKGWRRISGDLAAQ